MSGFFDTFTAAPSGLSYIGKEEKAILVNDGTVLTVKRVMKMPDQFNPGQQRYVLIIELDGEERGLGFGAGSVVSRDTLLDAMAEYLETTDAIAPEVCLVQSGRAVIIQEA